MSKTGLKIIFMGSPEFAAPSLKAIHNSHHDIIGVYTQPPRPAGRGKQLKKTVIHQIADELNIPVFTPKNFKNQEDIDNFAALKADCAVVCAYGLILPRIILDAPKLGCFNIHPSLLPRWRGASPIQRSIMAGDKETGVCIMQMDVELDAGDVLLEEKTPIKPLETADELHDRLAELGADMVLKTLDTAEKGYLKARCQDDNPIYAEKISKEEAHINWDQPAPKVCCHIRGLSPFPGAWSSMDNERIKILRSRVNPDIKGNPGEFIEKDGRYYVACQSGAIELIKLQRAGKKAMTAQDIFRGCSEPDYLK